MLRLGLLAALGLAAGMGGALAQEVSVTEGERVSVIGGCHDCHTVGYGESGGKIDPATALKGNPVGYQGPWGTTYAKNLRLIAQNYDENGWVDYLKTFTAKPPMPYYNVHRFTEGEMRSLYQYIKSLGEPGDPAPEELPPGAEPKTPYAVFAPPIMPKS